VVTSVVSVTLTRRCLQVGQPTARGSVTREEEEGRTMMLNLLDPRLELARMLQGLSLFSSALPIVIEVGEGRESTKASRSYARRNS
jgi:hypothetical protein